MFKLATPKNFAYTYMLFKRFNKKLKDRNLSSFSFLSVENVCFGAFDIQNWGNFASPVSVISFTRIYWNLPAFTGNYRHLPALTAIYRYLQRFTGIYQHLPLFTRIYRDLPVFTRIYRNLPGFTGIYRDLP